MPNEFHTEILNGGKDEEKENSIHLDIFLFIASSVSLVYASYYQAKEMSITSWVFLIVAISSLIRIIQEIKEGFK